MRAEDLVFWLDTLRPDSYQSSGVLCQRHAESMVVPRHWTLDDLRDPVPRLFRPPTSTSTPTAAPPTRRRKSGVDATVEQLLLAPEPTPPDVSGGDAVAAVDVVEVVVEEIPAEERFATRSSADDDGATPWRPTFDESDDLDGLLSARSPLLARAFRGDDRPKPG
jgi:hypothetical protein